MKVNKAGIDLIKEFEGLRLEAYKVPSWRLDYWLRHNGPRWRRHQARGWHGYH